MMMSEKEKKAPAQQGQEQVTGKKEEFFEVIDESTGKVTGLAKRSECHGNPSLLHRSVHVLILHPDGKSILLQKRSMRKDIQPGKWDCAVGGHLMPGEDYIDAAKREMSEEIGLSPDKTALTCLFDWKIRNERESENVRVFSAVSAGPFKLQESELDALAFHTFEDLARRLREGDTEDFTPVLQDELKRILPPGLLS